MPSECTIVNKTLAEKIAEKRTESYTCVMTYKIHKNKAQICTFQEHPCCNTRIEANEAMFVHLQDLTDIDFGLIPRLTIM